MLKSMHFLLVQKLARVLLKIVSPSALRSVFKVIALELQIFGLSLGLAQITLTTVSPLFHK